MAYRATSSNAVRPSASGRGSAACYWLASMVRNAVAALALSCPGAALAQVNTGPYNPTYGTAAFADRTAHPMKLWVGAGGGIDARTLAADCIGYVSWQPDYVIDFDKALVANHILQIDVFSPADTMLMVRDEQGNWLCSANDGGYVNPRLQLYPSRSFRYPVWVGLFDRDGGAPYGSANPTALLHLSNGHSWDEVPLGPEPHQWDQGLVTGHQTAGFTPDPVEYLVAVGGPSDLRDILPGTGCWGHIAPEPALNFSYRNDRGTGTLYFFDRSPYRAGTSLVVLGPDGVWRCHEPYDASDIGSMGFRNPASGYYKVWIASERPVAERGQTHTYVGVTELPQNVRR